MNDLLITQYALGGRATIDRVGGDKWIIRNNGGACMCKDGTWMSRAVIEKSEDRGRNMCWFDSAKEAADFWDVHERRRNRHVIYKECRLTTRQHSIRPEGCQHC
jgi:hypothetical protein